MAYNSRLKSEQTDALFEAILTLDTMDDCYRFFEDICTIKEIQAIAQRLEVAKQLRENKTYNEIEAETGASTATISRINRSLNYGADGYNLIFRKLGLTKE
ncbi:MAG: YerC/YecD family TrpR-related protein [Ezakiella sp.]|mgnify:CR=1 FL=1|uniref:Trp operon repressor family n=1 Tax=Ezakiella coagulans TaxID=46507 RepID=A0A2U1E4K1_9FIRM|nr:MULTISPECIES: YerC/YecD family TrpR-related protein [Ezakiella]KGF07941.1 TrpR-like protein YerC/YecD [Tissierellia bacterium S7-1-4]MDD7731717.1 YerC/YecD family TrpR-related protein [Eubacteriales bacterium]MDY6079985.1 YerC/YecD family TrpR-related protein [Ezakiella sp.]PVY94851.1 Trp operon repressor family [Ezakiella coagulans]UQK61043.1 YerC/YecD family TrpR-related protein [Ezakiella coagulans]